MLSCCVCDVTLSTMFLVLVLHLNSPYFAFVCVVPFCAEPHSIGWREIDCLDLVVQILRTNESKSVPPLRVPGALRYSTRSEI